MGYGGSPLPASREGPSWGVGGGRALWLAVAVRSFSRGSRRATLWGLPLELQLWDI